MHAQNCINTNLKVLSKIQKLIMPELNVFLCNGTEYISATHGIRFGTNNL